MEQVTKRPILTLKPKVADPVPTLAERVRNRPRLDNTPLQFPAVVEAAKQLHDSSIAFSNAVFAECDGSEAVIERAVSELAEHGLTFTVRTLRRYHARAVRYRESQAETNLST